MFGDLRVGPDPDAVVDHAADVLGELAVDRRLDRADRLVEEHVDRELIRANAQPPGCRRRSGRAAHGRAG